MTAKKSEALILKNDMEMPGLIENLNKKISELKHIEESVYRTSGKLEGFVINLKEEMKIENLIKMKASLIVRKNYYDEAAKSLGRKSYPDFKVDGFSIEDWDKDIQLRIQIIEHKDTLDKLNSFKEKAAKLMSEQDQKNMLINEMKNFFKG
jgi:hypothetical protein